MLKSFTLSVSAAAIGFLCGTFAYQYFGYGTMPLLLIIISLFSVMCGLFGHKMGSVYAVLFAIATIVALHRAEVAWYTEHNASPVKIHELIIISIYAGSFFVSLSFAIAFGIRLIRN